MVSSPPLHNESARGDIRSLWSSVCCPLQRLKIGKDQNGQNGISLLYDEAAFPVRKKHTVQSVLKRAREALSLGLVLASPDQGRMFHLVSADISSNSWIPTGKYLSFAEYRFTMRARLNLLPARSVQKRIRQISNDACRKCGRTHETLGHILNACTPSTGLMRARHNLVLHRLVRAIRPENKHIFVEQAISPDAVRPDLVVVDRVSRDTVVIDVTVPYEADRDAFEKARAEKVQKYSALIRWMSTQEEYRNPKFHAFLVGSLGAWSPENSAVFSIVGYVPILCKTGFPLLLHRRHQCIARHLEQS